MSQQKNHFEFLGLPERFELDTTQLQQVYLRLQAAVHPDRFANAGATEHRIAMQLATQVNEAYRTLLDPGRRAAYLCELHGSPIHAETHTAMSREFLTQQMQWREALEDARASNDRVALSGLAQVLSEHRARLLAEIGDAIDTRRNYGQAADAVRRWMFIDKFGAEVAAAEDAPGA